MAHKDKDKETPEEKAARRAAEIRAKTAAKEDKTAAKVERDQQRAVLESEARLKLAAKRREVAKAKRDESKENILQTIGDFATDDILGDVVGWNKRQEEAQTEYEESLKAISGERSRGAATSASERGSRDRATRTAASGRETEIAKHIGAFGRLSRESQGKALKSIGFDTAEVPKVFRHPDDTLDRFLPEETYTQYTGPKGNVFTMPEKAIRSVIAADRIKGRGKKQERKDAEIDRVQSLATIAASIEAGKEADKYELAQEREGEQYELAKVRSEARTAETRKWLKGEGEKKASAAFELGQYAAGAMTGKTQEEVFANLTALRGGKPLATTSEERGRAYLSGSQKKELKTSGERDDLAYRIGVGGGSSEKLKPFTGMWDKDGKTLTPEIQRSFDAGNVIWSSIEEGRVARLEGEAIRRSVTWRVGKGLDELALPPETGLKLVDARPEGGWEIKSGKRVPTEAAKVVLEKEGSLYKVREIQRLTGKNPRIISVDDISRQHNAALLRNTSEAQQLVARAMDENRTGRDRVEDTADAIRATEKGPVRDEALRVFYANEAVIALREIPKDEKEKRTAWKMAMKAHSPPSDNEGNPIGVPLTKAGGEPKWAIVVDWYAEEDANGNPVPVVYVADNPAATLSDIERLERDKQRRVREIEVMEQYKTSYPANVKGTPYTITPVGPPKGTKKSRGNR